MANKFDPILGKLRQKDTSSGGAAPVIRTITAATANITSADSGKILTNAGSTVDTVWTFDTRANLGDGFQVGIVNEVGGFVNVFTGGTASDDDPYPGPNYDASKAFDGSVITRWSTAGTTPMPHWIKYDLGVGNEKMIRALRVYARLNDMSSWTFEASNNNSTWTTLYTGITLLTEGWHLFNFSNDTNYRYYRINITSPTDDYYASIYEIQASESEYSSSIILTPATGEQLPNTPAINTSVVLSSKGDSLTYRATDTGIACTALNPVGDIIQTNTVYKGEWTLVERKEFSAPATSCTFSGLNGDVDRRYKIVARYVRASDTATNLLATFNTDTSANYTYRMLFCDAGTVYKDAGTSSGIYIGATSKSGFPSYGEMVIDAKSGVIRKVDLKKQTSTTGSVMDGMYFQSIAWTNTADNIIQIVFNADQTDGIGIGSYIELWKLAQ